MKKIFLFLALVSGLAAQPSGGLPKNNPVFSGTISGPDAVLSNSLTLLGGTAPSTSSAGQASFDTNAWASGRGAIQLYDGTANTYLIGVLATDTPTNGQFPRWNTGGTITWETVSGTGNVSNTGTPTAGQAAEWTDATTIQGVAATGTGNYVKSASPSLTGVVTYAGTQVNTAAAMGALVIDVTKRNNTKTISADSTFTFSGTPANSYQWFGMTVTNSDSSSHTLTIPSSFSMTQQTAITSLTIAASGKLYLAWWYDGSTYLLFGDPGSSSGGTVTTVSVITANGVSGSVATATTTPAITISLGAITPSSVTVSGTASVGSTLTASTTIELGNASDTTLARVSAGVVSIEGSNIMTIASTDTITGAKTFSTAAALGSSTATTQSAADNSTKVSTTAYADRAARATNLGTFASPDTTAGAITWVSPVYNIYTSAGSTLTYTLPAASSYTGQAFILNVAVGTGHVNVQPASGASLVLAGMLLTANHYVQAATSAPGNYICFISDGTNWTSLGSSGTWADAASP